MVLQFFYDAPGFTEITELIDAKITIPSVVDAISSFSVSFNNYRGRVFDDIFDHAGAQIGVGLKCKFVKDGTDLFYGRIWGLNPLIREDGDRIIITGQGFDRELAVRKIAESQTRDTIEPVLEAMLTKANTFHAFKDLSLVLQNIGGFAPDSLGFRSSGTNKNAIQDYLVAVEDAFQVSFLMRYNYDTTGTHPTKGGELTHFALSDITSEAGLQTGLTLTNILGGGSSNNIVEGDVRFEAVQIRNIINLKVPSGAPGYDGWTESITGWVSTPLGITAAIEDSTFYTKLTPRGGESSKFIIADNVLDNTADVIMTLTISDVYGATQYEPLALAQSLLSFSYACGATEDKQPEVRLLDSAGNIIKMVLPIADNRWYDAAGALGDAYIGGVLPIWTFTTGSTFNWKIEKITFILPATSGTNKALAIDRLYFAPVRTSYKVEDTTSINDFGPFEMDLNISNFKDVTDLVDFANGILIGYKNPLLLKTYKTTLDPIVDGIVYPNQALKVDVPRLGFTTAKWWRIDKVVYELDENGFYSSYTIDPAEVP